VQKNDIKASIWTRNRDIVLSNKRKQKTFDEIRKIDLMRGPNASYRGNGTERERRVHGIQYRTCIRIYMMQNSTAVIVWCIGIL